MALHWSYNADFTNVTPGYSTGSTVGQRDQIRLLIQDTNSARQLLQDEEIDWFQTQEMNVFTMAAACCETLVASVGTIKSKKISEFSITFDVEFYKSLAARLRARGATYQTPYAGGISITDKDILESDPDWVPPAFSKNLDNNPAAPQPTVAPANPLSSI